MNEQEIQQKVERFIVEELMMASSNTKIDRGESLIEKGVLDSLSLLRLISFVEQEFGITVEDGEVMPENFESVNVTVGFVATKLK